MRFRNFSQEIRIENIEDTVSEFYRYCRIDERLEHSVSKDYRNIARRLLRFSKGIISRETIRGYLSTYLTKTQKTYNNQLDGLRAFVSRFLMAPELMAGFKKAHQEENFEIELPTKEQIKRGFEALDNDRDRALFLFYATTGLRRTEVLKLNRFEDIDYELRAVKSKHNTRTKKAGVTFYNEECEYWLKRYLAARDDESEKLFKIGWGEPFQKLWKRVSKKAGVILTPQVLRKWHATMLGELGVPDRFVDVFQGRAPKSVLAKFYTGKELLRLKGIYDRANLEVLS